MKDSFSKSHPFVSLCFFIAVLSFSMFITNPVCIVISIFCAAVNAALICPRRALRVTLVFLLPMSAFAVIVNPVFNHGGATTLGYLPWGNPLTLESIIYGFVAAGLLCSAALWFVSFNRIITSDKIIYITGRAVPSLSLLISMALRFVPRFTAEFKAVRAARKSARSEDKGIKASLSSAVKLISAMITRALENSIETADSMKGRGYGLKGRTAFSRYRFKKTDAVFSAALIIESGVLIYMALSGAVSFRYFPSLKGDLLSANAVVFYVIYTLMMLMPTVLSAVEGLKWKLLRSAV